MRKWLAYKRLRCLGGSFASLFCAFETLATLGLNMFVEILLAVVVGELFAWFDSADSPYKHTPGRAVGLAIGNARVINKASCVLLDIAVDRFITRDLKNIFAVVSILLCLAHWPTDVLDNASALRDFFFGVEAFAGF